MGCATVLEVMIEKALEVVDGTEVMRRLVSDMVCVMTVFSWGHGAFCRFDVG